MQQISLLEQEEELIKHINFYKNIFDLMTDLIFIFTPSLNLKLINNASINYYRVNNLIKLDQNIKNLKIFPNYFKNIIKKLQSLDQISLPIIHINTTENLYPDKEIEICWTMSYLNNEQKVPIGIILIGKVNIEKYNTKRINYLQSCLDTIIDSVPGNIYWKSTDGVYLGCNEVMVKKSNLKCKEDLIGKTDEELWPGSPFWKNDQEVINANKTLEIQETVTINSGEKLYFVSIKTPLKDENNKTIGIVGNSLDVTEIINAKAKAEEANNVKTQFLLNMQHDIKTPISHIIGLSNIISNMENLPGKVKEYINYIQISGERLMSLIVEILHYCDIETSKKTDEQEWNFNLLDLVENTRDLYIIPLKEKKLNFSINHDIMIANNLIGNKNKIHRIIINLLDNAIKFTHQGNINIYTKLVKTLEYPKVIIELTVEDTGIGIPPEKYETIFDRFSRLSPSGDSMYKGLGLGLWIVKQLAKEMNGEIYVNSIIDKGSRFRLVFPCKIAYL